MTPIQYNAIIMAGGENKNRLARVSPQPYEALIEISGRPMVAYVAEALLASPYISRVLIVGPADCLAKCQLPPGVTVLQGGRAIIESLKIGIAAAGGTGKVLVATADIPLLTPEAVNDFIGKCSGLDADLYYPVVSREVNRRAYPKTERTYVRLREGTFTGGNLILLNPEIVARCEERAEYIFRYRKNPYILCRMLGWGFVLKFAFRQLGLREVEQRMSEILGIRGVVIQSSYPEVGIDVDKPSDLELVRAAFAGRA